MENVFGGGKKDAQDITGTPNSQYDLVSSLHQSLQWAATLGTYIKDAQKDNDDELTTFFQQIQTEEQNRVVLARNLLANRFNPQTIEGSSSKYNPGSRGGILGEGGDSYRSPT